MKKIFIFILLVFFSINSSNAWIGLIAETGDLLNISKWNEFVNTKLSRADLKAGNNISLTNSGSEIYINKGVSVSVPFISTTTQIEIPGESTTTITLTGENFESGSLVSISGITVNSVSVLSPLEIEINLTTGNTGIFDVVVNNNGKLNTLWANNGEDLIKVVPVEIVGNDSNGRKWTNGKFAKTCNDYKNPTNPYTYAGDTGDGIYIIKPDPNKSEFKVYCDMTTDNGGWTRFVNIKGDYTKQNAIDCWKGINIDNSNLECFNPNRYNLQVAKLFNEDWNGNNYFYDMIDSNSSVTTQTDSSSRKCLGHSEYMTIMKSNSSPNPDGSDTQYVRLARNFCKYSRDPAGRGGSFMNYDSSGDFGESDNAARESNARLNKIYFR